MEISIQEIYDTISKHYKQHSSLYLTREAKSSDIFFYNFCCPESAAGMIEAMNNISKAGEIEIKSLEGRLHDTSVTAFRCDEYMVKVQEHTTVNSNYASISFYGITGIKVSKVYRRFHAKLTYNPKHLISIYINLRTGDMYGKGVRKGTVYPMSFSSYINKLLLHSPEFKEIFKELLMLCSGGKHIMKDIVRTIDEDGYMAMPVTVFDVKKYRTKDALVRGFTGTDLKADFNKQSLNQAYLFAELSKEIPERQIGFMTQLDRKIVVDTLREIFRESYPLDDIVRLFVTRYYMEKLKMENERWNRLLIYDYIRMARDQHAGISINFKTENRLVREHDRLARVYDEKRLAGELDKPLIADNTRFDELRKILPKEFEWITDIRRLQEEGRKQHNCVFSYRDKIRADESTIYHWSRDGRNYTIEFGWAPGGKFTIEQMMQVSNRFAEEEDLKYVEKLLGKKLGKPQDRPVGAGAWYDEQEIFGRIDWDFGDEDVPF